MTKTKPLNPPRLLLRSEDGPARTGNLAGIGPKDPLAQSFFTYGVPGGCFVTKIDVFFQSKDASAPVMIELRNMVNGFPVNELTNKFARVSKPASEIQVSEDASIATSFVFERPIYLPENSDFCFVLMANTNNYFVWTSKLSEKSNETGQIVTEQPYVGSLFKSENNITWNAEQYEDIKFTIYKAKFDTSANASIDLYADPLPFTVYGENIFTIQGTNKVIIQLKYQHGLEPGALTALVSPDDSVSNGISAADFNGSYEVVDVLSPYAFTVKVAGIATSSGPVLSAGNIQDIEVTNGGSGYTSVPTVSFIGTGTGAAGTAIVENGSVVGINITNKGTGYTSPPEVVISGVGVNATARTFTQAVYSVYTNVVAHTIFPLIFSKSVGGSTTEMRIKTTKGNSFGGTATPYQFNEEVPFSSNGRIEDETAWIASRFNASRFMSGASSMDVKIDLYSQNENVSSYVDVNEYPKVLIKSNRINNQTGENVDFFETNSSGFITSTLVSTGGSGYTVAPTVFVTPPDLPGGVPAELIANVSGGSVISIDIENEGSGYFAPPMILIAPPPSGTQATAQAAISTFNSELLPTGGRAASKYITRPINLETPSTGIKVFCTAYSTAETSFEFYVRTSLSSSPIPHTQNPYKMMKCEVDRNKSVRKGQYLEYSFELMDISQFDVLNFKIVLRSSNQSKMPYISDYRAIVVV